MQPAVNDSYCTHSSQLNWVFLSGVHFYVQVKTICMNALYIVLPENQLISNTTSLIAHSTTSRKSRTGLNTESQIYQERDVESRFSMSRVIENLIPSALGSLPWMPRRRPNYVMHGRNIKFLVERHMLRILLSEQTDLLRAAHAMPAIGDRATEKISKYQRPCKNAIESERKVIVRGSNANLQRNSPRTQCHDNQLSRTVTWGRRCERAPNRQPVRHRREGCILNVTDRSLSAQASHTTCR